MKAHHYSSAVVMLGGKPTATADLGMTSFREPASPFVAPPNYTVSATFRGTGSPDAFLDLAPNKPAVVNVTMTWGILGPLTFPAWVADSTLRQTPEGVSAEMGMVPDERALRRAVSTAVQRAIMNPHRLDYVARDAARQEDPTVRAMARLLVAPLFPGGCYRGARKRRKAMRRLLRAAGILGGGQ